LKIFCKAPAVDFTKGSGHPETTGKEVGRDAKYDNEGNLKHIQS